METRGTRIALGVWVGARARVPLHPDRASSASTRSTRRTCRAGRSPGLTTKWFSPAIHNGDMQQALWLSLKAAALATLDRARARLGGVVRRAPLPLLRPRGDLVPARAADRAARDHHRHGAELVLHVLEVQLRALDDRDRPRDVLRRRRLQQRDRAAAPRARLADRGVDGPRRGRLADVPLRHVPDDLDRADLGRPARVRALVRRGDRDDVHRRRAEHAADLDLRPDPPRPAAARR